MTPAEAVEYFVATAPRYVPTFDSLVGLVRIHSPDATATEIDAAARPYEVGRPGAYRYEREGGPWHCPCQSDADDVGATPHIEACPWSDPDYCDGAGIPF